MLSSFCFFPPGHLIPRKAGSVRAGTPKFFGGAALLSLLRTGYRGAWRRREREAGAAGFRPGATQPALRLVSPPISKTGGAGRALLFGFSV